ncbi:MAG: efflux RND transporter periplasmic adaptor subunit [Proteobacteria bacterium]|nr:efflux RND transporter periplasmic adaptor subunit [Pseudomonadota bacterium]
MKQAIATCWVFATIIIGFGQISGHAAAQSNTSQKAAPPAVLVSVAKKQEIADQFVFYGRVEATARVEIRARIDGYLGPLAFEQGSFVKEGDLLFQIEKDLYQAAVAQAKANLANSQAAAKLAKIELDRSKELRGRNVVAQSQLDENSAKYEEALADVKSNQADLDLAEINLGYTDIKAPISGRIGKATETKGSLVGPSSEALALLVAQDPIQVSWPVPDRLFTEISRRHESNDSVNIKLRLPDDSIYELPGKIIYSEPSANSTTNTVTVRAEFPNPESLLVDQQLVTVLISRKDTEERLVIPQNALLLDQQGSYVLAVNDKNVVEVKRITTGAQEGSLMVIESGLKEGDKVIVTGLQKVRKGMEVDPKPATAESASQ